MSNFNQTDDQYYTSVITQNPDQDMASPSQNSPMGNNASNQTKNGSTETSGQVMIFFANSVINQFVLDIRVDFATQWF